MALKQPFWGYAPNNGTLPASTSTRYFGVLTSHNYTGLTAFTQGVTQPIDHAITLRNFRVVLGTAPGSGVSRTFTIVKNGSATSLAVTITGTSQTTAIDTSNDVSFAAGDTVRMDMTVSGGTPAVSTFAFVIEGEGPDVYTSLYNFGEAGLNTEVGNTVSWDGALYGGRWTTSNADFMSSVVATPGTITGYRVLMTTAPGAAKTRTIHIFKNGVKQDGTGGTVDTTLTFTGTGTNVSQTATFSLTVAATDRLYIQQDPGGTTPATTWIHGSLTFVADDPGVANFGFCADDLCPQAGATEYCWPYGVTDLASWDVNEVEREIYGPESYVELSGLYVHVTVAPGSGKSLAFTVRENQGDTAQTCTIADSATSASSGGALITFSSGDELSIECVGTGSSMTSRIHGAMLLSEPTSTNVAPTVDAGDDASANVLQIVQLDGTVSDDGFPLPPTLTQVWTKQSGPGDAFFSDDEAVDPTVYVDEPGVYVLRLTASDTVLSAYDEMTLTVGTGVDPGNTICGEGHVLTWIEQTYTETDDGTTTRVTSDAALNDPSTYYAGKKEPRILELPTISRYLSDTRGQWQAGTMRWREAEVDRIVRRRFGATLTWPVTYATDICRMIKESEWRDQQPARLMFVGHRLRSTPHEDLSIEHESGDVLARDLEKAGEEVELPRRLFATAFIPGIPAELVDVPEAIVYGHFSDALSTETPPELIAESTANDGAGGFMDGTYPNHGFAPMGDPEPPASLTPTENGAASGSLMLGDVPGDDYYFNIVGWNSTDGFGDPTYFDIGSDVTIQLGADNKSITVSWTNPIPNDATSWRVTMGMYYVGVRRIQYIDTAGANTSVTFDNCPSYAEWALNDYSELATGAEICPGSFYHWRVAAVLADGSVTALNDATNTGFTRYEGWQRTARLEVDETTLPVTATHVRVYRMYPGWIPGQPVYGYLEAPVDQVLANDNVYIDDDWAGTGLVIEGPAVEQGAHDITAYYGGKESLPATGRLWHRWFVCGHAVKDLDAYLNGTTNYAVPTKLVSELGTVWLVPGGAGYTEYVGPTTYRDFNGRRYTVIYGYIGNPDADDVAAGTGTLRVNIDGTETAGDGSGTLITDVYDQFKHFFVNYFLQDYQSGAYLSAPTWDPIAGWPKVDTDSWDTARDAAEDAFGASVPGAGVIRDLAATRSWLATWLQSTGTRIGINAGGQWRLVRHDPDADTAETTYTEVRHIQAGSLTFTPLHDEHWTRIEYRFYPKPDGTWSEGEVFDAAVEEDVGEERPGPTHDLYFITAANAAEFLMELTLERHKTLPWRVAFETINLCGTNTDLGDVIGLTHTAGLDVDGWDTFLLHVEGHDTFTGDQRTRITTRCNQAPHL